ncbi:hypothetical protein NXY48_17180 [Bacteroides ovatus]|nr:hypothetical protein [Bacteroides ovatus]
MKKNILYLLLGILALTSSCQDPEYVLPYCGQTGNHELDCTLYFWAIRG